MPRSIQLICLCLAFCLAACASSGATPPSAEVAASPQAHQLEIVATPSAITSVASGVSLTAAAWQLQEDRPDRDRLEVRVCFTAPDVREWWTAEATLTVEDVALPLTDATGEATADDQVCQTLAFAVPVETPLVAPVLTIPFLRTQPESAELCARFIPEVQRRLEARQPGLRVACEEAAFGPQAWVTHRPTALTARAAQAAFEALQAEVDREWHWLAGPWSITLPAADLPRLTRLTLLDPAARPTPSQVGFTLQAVHRYPQVLRLEVCYSPPTDGAWQIGEAVLEAGLTEIALTTTAALPTGGRMCEWLSAEWRTELAHTAPRLKIYTLRPHTDPARPGACATAAARLNSALAAREYGVTVACDEQAWGWQIQLVEKPAAVSEAEAQALIHSDELDALRGLWVLPIALPPLPNPSPAPGEAGIVADDLVNVRAGPGTHFEVIGQIWPEEAYAIIGQAGAWWQIRYGAPGGWVSAEVVRPTP